MILKNKKKFCMGLIGLFSFSIVFCLCLFPVIGGKSGVQFADDLFNQLAKNSAYHVPSAVKKAEQFKGFVVDVSVNPRWPEADKWVSGILAANGASASPVGDGRVRVRGDLGLLSMAAAADADLLYKGQEGELRKKYGLSGREVIYYWWTAFDDFIRRYVQLNRAPEADFARFMTTRVLEPSYNFVGIEQRKISENPTIVTLLLAFYVIYTVWYGFSILYLFEGLGIRVTKASVKKEA